MLSAWDCRVANRNPRLHRTTTDPWTYGRVIPVKPWCTGKQLPLGFNPCVLGSVTESRPSLVGGYWSKHQASSLKIKLDN